LFQILDHVISAYRCGSFEKILEFIKLRDRLSASQQYTTATIERMLMDLLVETSAQAHLVHMMQYMGVDPEKDEVNWKDLTDNRDFKAMPSFDPAER
jgi:N-terminal acetyltransferase B complex non-catalytic subunit